MDYKEITLKKLAYHTRQSLGFQDAKSSGEDLDAASAEVIFGLLILFGMPRKEIICFIENVKKQFYSKQ